MGSERIILKLKGLTGRLYRLFERKRLQAEAREYRRSGILRYIIERKPLPMLLDYIVTTAEMEDPGSIASILLLDEEGRHLLTGAAPGLPDFYNQAVHGLEIGDGVGSCGTAAYTKKRVIVKDIQSHPYWEPFRELAQQANLRSCWSEPIISSGGQVLGTFAIYHRVAKAPREEDIYRLQNAIDFAALAIENKRAEEEIKIHRRHLEMLVKERTAKLAESEERFRIFFNSGSDAIFVSELLNGGPGNFIAVNDIACERLGYTREELLLMSVRDINVSKSMPVVLEKFDQIRTEGRLSTESIHLTKEGKEIPVEVNATVINLEGKQGVLAIARDITERKQAERKLQQLASLVTSSEALIVGLDEHGVIQTWNRGAELIFGYSAAEIIGKSVTILVPADNFSEIPHLIGKLKRGEKIEGYETKRITKDGDVIEISITVSPIKDSTGNMIGASTIGIDITARKKLESEVQKLYQSIEKSDVTVIITNLDGIIEYVNPYFISHTGFSAEDAIGNTPRIMKSGHHPGSYYKKLWATIQSGNVWQAEVCNRKKNGESYWEQMTISPIKDTGGNITHYVSIQVDITELKKTQAELEKAKALSDAANRSKSEFLTNMTHELRTPMNAMLGFASLLSLRASDEQDRTYLKAIETSGNHLLTMINDLLDLSRLTAGQTEIYPEETRLTDLFNEIGTLFRYKASEKGLQFNVDCDPSLPPLVLVDAGKVKQVLINLVGNAVKFTQKGHIRVLAEWEPTDPMKTTSKAVGQGALHISVEDTGIGITPGNQPAIFDSFFQQDMQVAETYGGTGLGLAISRQILEQMHGTIRLTSKPGEGSCFYVWLPDIPVLDVAPEKQSSHLHGSVDVTFTGGYVLVVDENALYRTLETESLKHLGLSCQEAINGKEALAALEKKVPGLILTNLEMSGMNGFELMDAIKRNEKWQTIPVLASTSICDRKEKDHLLEYGFSGVLSRPVHIEELTTALKRFFPFTEKNKERIPTLSDPEKIMKNLPDSKRETLIPLMEALLANNREAISGSGSISDVEQFARALSKLEQEQQTIFLAIYHSSIRQAIDTFDVEALERLKVQYPVMIEYLKNKPS